MTHKIQTFHDYRFLKENNYTVKELKDIYVLFKLKWKQRKKHDIVDVLYSTLRDHSYACTVQKYWRRYMVVLFHRSQGPARLDRSLCNNEEDFLTTEPVKKIDYRTFISFREDDKFIYGFEVGSIFTLIDKKMNYNPYTRRPFTSALTRQIERRALYNRVLFPSEAVPERVLTYEQKIIGLFQKMDTLGNYTQSEWLLRLNDIQLKRFIFELYDIWGYRAHLSSEMKRNICPPNGNPFHSIPMMILEGSHPPLDLLKQYTYSILHDLLYRSNQTEYQVLGAYYILSALTLVSIPAADALPWLYESVL
jgi:hypothetical protein